MGALFFFDAMLEAPENEARDASSRVRQVEIFSHGHELWLRVGEIGEQSTGVGVRTVKITGDVAAELINGLQRGMRYLGKPIDS